MIFSGMAARIAAASLSAGLATGAVAMGVNAANNNDRPSTEATLSAPSSQRSVSAGSNGPSAQAGATVPEAGSAESSAGAQGASAAAVLNPVGGVLQLPNGTVVGLPSAADAKKLVNGGQAAVGGVVTGAQPGSVALPGTPTPPTTPTVPSAPAVEVDTSPFAKGSYTLLVPGTPGVTKELCISGDAAERCVPVTVNALQPTTVTVAYSGNTGAEVPTYAVATCTGGLSLTVGALTPGTTVTVSANNKTVTRQLAAGERSQTASFCDA